MANPGCPFFHRVGPGCKPHLDAENHITIFGTLFLAPCRASSTAYRMGAGQPKLGWRWGPASPRNSAFWCQKQPVTGGEGSNGRTSGYVAMAASEPLRLSVAARYPLDPFLLLLATTELYLFLFALSSICARHAVWRCRYSASMNNFVALDSEIQQ